MVVIVEAGKAAEVSRILTAEGETVVELGAVEARTGEPVVYEGRLGF
jgi:hypothetical protein